MEDNMPDEVVTPFADGVGIIQGRMYNFLDWYWLAEDGRIWSSKKRAQVTADDPEYVAWLVGGGPTEWPRDEAGNQTDEALTAVFESYDIKVAGEPINGTVNAYVVKSSRPSSKSKSK
jgi:hypothetical protein